MITHYVLTYLSPDVTKKTFYTLQIALLLLLFAAPLLPAPTLYAAADLQATDSCDLVIEIIAAPNAVVDSNKPGVQGPQVVMLGARITNKGALARENLQLAIGDGATPGTFPSGGSGALALLAKQTPTQWLPTLAPGQNETFYWAVTYPPTMNVSYPYVIWAANAAGCQGSAKSEITTQRTLSTNANKLLPTGSMVQIAPGAVVPGAIVTIKITGFTLGTVGQGQKANYESWIQPVGNPDFDPTCLRFLQSKVVLNSISATPFVDQFYFTGFQNYRQNIKDYVEYTFVALRNCATPLQPYQRASSGTQDKYNGDYGVRGARIGVKTEEKAKLAMALTVDKATVNPGDTVTLAIDFAAEAGNVGAPESGSPALITAAIPSTTFYRSGSVQSLVAATVEYSTDHGQTWQSAEPSDPATVTNLRWLLHQPVTNAKEKATFAVVVKGSGGNCVTGNATIGLLNSDPLLQASATVNCATPTPTPTPMPTATPDPGVGSGGDGGLESGPLPGEPSAFTGSIGASSGEASAAATNAVTLRQHKARLLNAMRIRLEDIIPPEGPAGTTPKPAVPVDVLAITNAPEAKAIDFVDGNGRIQAVALGILSLGGPYEHDYGVCNRFKEYTFDTIEPRQLALPNGESGWFWHSHATKNDNISEEALFLHVFVDETDKRFHIDSRWIKDDYPSSFDFDFDYVFTLQLWSNDLTKTQELLAGVLNRLDQHENGAWRSVYHNQTRPAAASLFVTRSSYQLDEVELALHNFTTETQSVRLYGAWRDQINRNTLQPFEYTIELGPDESLFSLIFPGLLDATIYVESKEFTDKIYQGGGLWFPVKGEQENAPTMSFSQCRQLDEIDTTDLTLVGCADLTTPSLAAGDQAGIGRTLNPNGRSVDVSPYKALRFWAKGNGVPVRVVLETAGVTNNDYFQTTFTPDAQWRQYMLPLAQFARRAATDALEGTDVKAVLWLNAESAGRPLELSIDQVSFTNQGLLAELALPAATTNTAAQPLQVSGPSGIAQVTAHYSVDGATFQSVTLNQQAQNDPEQVNFQGELPGQALGADVIYYLETTYTNGYVSRSPLDAPASYYRYRVDDRAGLLIDDFAGVALRNRLNGANGVFNHTTTGGRLSTYRANHALILDYDVRSANQFAGYFTNLSSLDARSYTTLDLLVKGAAGGEQMRIGLRNSQNVEKYVSVGALLPGGITDEWQWVQIPLRNFAPQMDLSALTSLNLFFANSDGNSQGRLYVKEMRFTTLGAPLVIDNFDDASLESNGQLMGYWTSAPNSTLNATLVAGDAQKATGKALQLQYTIGANGYAVWNSSLKQPAVQPESLLTFWVKGEAQAVPASLYLTSGNGRARVALKDYVSWNNQWQRVEIPVSAFSGQGFDLNGLTGLQVVFEFAQGRGTLWLDQIQIGAPGAPQANQRLLYLRDVDAAAVALHLPYGGAWQAESDAPWLFTSTSGAGATSLTVRSVNWELAPGVYTGKVTIRTAGQTETITAQLTVTQTGAPATRLFLPFLIR